MKPDSHFWHTLDSLVAQSETAIDRPQGSTHPRYPEVIYPFDYGYLANTASGDGDGIDIWLGSLPGKVPTARACEGIFLHLSDELSTSLINCPSGRELCDRGFSGDVDHAAHLNCYDTVPVMRDERLKKLAF